MQNNQNKKQTITKRHKTTKKRQNTTIRKCQITTWGGGDLSVPRALLSYSLPKTEYESLNLKSWVSTHHNSWHLLKTCTSPWVQKQCDYRKPIQQIGSLSAGEHEDSVVRLVLLMSKSITCECVCVCVLWMSQYLYCLVLSLSTCGALEVRLWALLVPGRTWGRGYRQNSHIYNCTK